jgi:hypothetical protein
VAFEVTTISSPAKAGVQEKQSALQSLGPRFRGERNLRVTLPVNPEMPSPALAAVAEQVVGEDQGHHRLAHGHGADADAGIVPALC